MTRFGYMAAALGLGVVMTLGSPVVPGSVEKASAAMTKEERAAARAAAKAKRADCQAQAKEQKLRLLKRARFVRDCMKKA